MTLLKMRFDTTPRKPDVMKEARREAGPRVPPSLFARATRIASGGCGRNRAHVRSDACHAALHRALGRRHESRELPAAERS
jgi:hypothetical protein